MNKGLFGFFFILVALIVGALYYTNTIQSPFLSLLQTIRVSYHNSIAFVAQQVEKHFFQASHIAELQEKLKFYENNDLALRELSSELNNLFLQNHSALPVGSQTELVRAVAYQNFGDFNRVWLEVEDYNASRIYGLVSNNLVAGIVISHNERPLALLNGDTKSSYAVYVGEGRAPGIAHGNNSEHLLVQFIPAWFLIQEGDRVITSGLDKIFFEGLDVGVVTSVTKSQGYQTAVVEPFYKPNTPNYFHMIKKAK